MSIKLARKLPLAALVATVAALFLAQTAFAADSSVEAYGGSGGKVQAHITDPGSPSADSTGSLPFTGMDLGLAAGGAVVLLAAGAAMGTFARRERTHLE